MAKDPTFPFYASDYLVDTLRWSRDMKSLHVDLLAESWINGPLMDEHGFPSGLTAVDQGLWLRINHKWKLVEGYWINEKLEEVRTARKNFIKRQSDKGKKSAESRASKVSDPLKEEKNNSTESQPKINSGSTVVEPIEKENESEKEKEDKKEKESPGIFEVELSPTFDDFWEEYDKKRGDKEKIRKKWQKLRQDEREAIMEYIPNYKASQPDKAFRKDPETFLNNKSWKDEIIFKQDGKQKNSGQANIGAELDQLIANKYRP
jgi:hypothetical protein